MDEKKVEALQALAILANQLGINLQDKSVSIAACGSPVIARTSNGHLEVELSEYSRDEDARVGSPCLPIGVHVLTIDRSREPDAPAEALYKIRTYTFDGEEKYSETGVIYIGAKGFVEVWGRDKVTARHCGEVENLNPRI